MEMDHALNMKPVSVIAPANARGERLDLCDQRAAPRFNLLMRAARLVFGSGEFVCVLRDVSEVGLSLRMFHRPPSDHRAQLHMPGGNSYDLRPVWIRGLEAGFEFVAPIDTARLISEVGQYPKRGVRLDLCFPIHVRTVTHHCEAIVENLSQQGARFESDSALAIDQSLQIESAVSNTGFPSLRAKVRWRRGEQYGVVFDDTFTLADFARLAAKVQAPGLLD